MKVLTNGGTGTQMWFRGFYRCSNEGKPVWLVNALSVEKIQKPNSKPSALHWEGLSRGNGRGIKSRQTHCPTVYNLESIVYEFEFGGQIMVGAIGFSNCQFQLKGFVS